LTPITAAHGVTQWKPCSIPSHRRGKQSYASVVKRRSHRRGVSSNISIALMVILGTSIVVGSVAGYTFLVVRHPSVTGDTTTATSEITTHTSSHSTTFSSSKGQTQVVSTTSGQTTASITTSTSGSQTQTLTSSRTSTSATSSSGKTSTSVTTSEKTSTSVASSGKTSVSSTTQTSTDQTSQTSIQTSTSGGITVSSTSVTSTTQTSRTKSVPLQVEIHGTVSTTGIGTRVSSIALEGAGNYYTPSIVNNAFSISLPNDETYFVSIVWTGAYSWQQGINFQQLLVYENISALSISWILQTPNSAVEVYGNVLTTGAGTQAAHISFESAQGVYNQTVVEGEYAISIPNDDSYNVSVAWTGEYSWQSGSGIAGNLNLNSNSSVVANWNLRTPNSMITLSGNLTASGIGTRPTSMNFTYGNSTLSFGTSLSGTSYSISLPNEATYSVRVGWTGEYSWQTGNVSAGDYSMNQLTAVSSSKNWNVQIPDTEVTISGTIIASGSDTQATQILFSGVSGNFTAVVIGGHYSIVLPNTVKYEATIRWSGSYSWQSGSVTYQLPVFAGAGSNSFSASWIVPTPNSTVIVSGTVTSQSGSPIEIRFVSTNGQVVVATSAVNNQYSIVLPDEMNYTVMIFLNGSSSPTNDGVFQLYAAPGVTNIVANWIS